MSFTIDDVIGGISTPRIYKLEDNNRIVNGSVEDTLSTEWFGSGYSRVLASSQSPAFVAPRGDYVMQVEDNDAASWEAAKQSIDYGAVVASKSFVLMLKVRASASNHNVDIKLGSSTTDSGNINNAAKLTVMVSTEYDRIIYLVKTFAGGETDEYIRVELGGCIDTVTSTGIAFYDDVRVYEIQDTYNLTMPNRYTQDWEEQKIAEYELIDGKNRSVSNGWRFILEMIYDYISSTDLKEVVYVTENGLNLIIPHIDQTFGSLMRWDGSYNPKYFKDRYDGHEITLRFKSVELEREKPREYSADFTLS
jgi:hypothetical protein